MHTKSTPSYFSRLFFPLAPIAVVWLASSACTPPEAICTSDDQCAEGFACNFGSQACEAVGAGSDAGPQDDLNPTCTREGDQCLVLPEGFQGPFLHLQAPIDAVLGGCGGAFPEEFLLMKSGIREEGSCSCSGCSRVKSMECGRAKIEEWGFADQACETNACQPEFCSSYSASAGTSCGPLPNPEFVGNGGLLKVTLPNVTAGTCNPPEAQGDLSVGFEKQHRLCQAAANSAATCAEGATCLPSTSQGERCVAREGLHECPQNEFTRRKVTYSGLDDQRTCSAASCNCEAPIGAECPGVVELYSGTEFSNCATLEDRIGFGVVANQCTQGSPHYDFAKFKPTKIFAPACEASGQAELVGAVNPTGATTLCCIPD